MSSASEPVLVPASPPGEDDDVLGRRDLGRRREPRGADRVQLAGSAGGVAEHDDDALHERLRRSQRKNSSVPITVTTSLTAFLPCSFDSPPWRSRMLHRHLLDPQTRLLQAQQRLHLRRAAHVRGRHHRHRLRVHRSHPARRVVERAAQPDVHRLLQEADAEAARGARLVAIGLVAVTVAKREPDGDVAGVGAHEVEQAP